MKPARYAAFSSYLKKRFSAPVRKICLDAGFSCPNRDGTLSREGCIFCRPPAYAPEKAGRSVAEQLAQGIAQGQARGIENFIAYFQPYSNTYGPPAQLQAAYSVIRDFPQIVALAVGTRPDCISEAVARGLDEFTADYEVWVELGLQSAHDQTLRRLNRGHSVADFYKSLEIIRRYSKIKIAGHVILGLPGEGPAEEIATAQVLARERLDGVKLHPLHVVKATALEKIFQAGEYIPLTQAEYVSRVAAFLEQLWPQTVIERLTADCPEEFLIAPLWMGDKAAVLQALAEYMEKENSFQGRRFAGPV